MDTRKGIGAAKAKLAAGQTDVLAVQGVSPLPTSGITAVTLNITETDTASSGYLVAYPDGSSLPISSTVNWSGGGISKAAGAIVPVGSDGKIDIHDGGAGNASADVIVDVTGYFTSTGSGDVYVPVPQERVLDTRTTSTASIGPGGLTEIDLTGRDGMPGQYLQNVAGSAIVDGYVLNTTVTQTPSNGYVLVSGSQNPGGTSTVNWTGTNQTMANLAFTQAQLSPLPNGGRDFYVWFYNGSTTGRVQVIADVMGYFTAS